MLSQLPALKSGLLLGFVFSLVLMSMMQSSAAEIITEEQARLDRLPEEQRAKAMRMIEFNARMDEKYFGWAENLNGKTEYDNRIIETVYSHYDLKVTHGLVVEKIGRMQSSGRKTNPGRGDSALIWGRFYAIDVHPKTPLVGMLHATIVYQFFEDGSMGVGGFFGVMPGTKVEKDLAGLAKVTEDHFAENGQSDQLEMYRKFLCKGTEETREEFRRRPACVGASFYGPPVFRGDIEKSYIFVEEFFEKFVDAYMKTIVERADDPFTDEDIAAQDTMRRRWLIDQVFSDPFASKIVPWNAWAFQNMPPVLKF